ncbi:hypothetical protein Salat_2527100 [Sesamum alatum]|uniref:Uncharacterized protein n=1 Tax=Sesamum alatum TaxID=300844 RepID=A0AAE1XSV8_9LAMI|nr:hypothetical protein Salat_2527100 [Sesamum alatum]
MNAQIANRVHALRGTLPTGVIPNPSSEVKTSVTPSGEDPQIDQSHYPAGSNIQALEAPKVTSDDINTTTQASENILKSHTPSREVGVSSSKGTEVEVAHAIEGPSEPKNCKRKHKHRSKSSRSSKSSKHRKSCSGREEKENLKLVKELTTWWKGGHEELRSPSCKVAEMEGRSEGFDQTLLDPALDGNLEAFPEDDTLLMLSKMSLRP